jgi:hypothetical protein
VKRGGEDITLDDLESHCANRGSRQYLARRKSSSLFAVLQKGIHAFHSTSHAEDVWWYFGATSDRQPIPSAQMQRPHRSTANHSLLHCKFTIHTY